jgi:peptide/nickel transport system permease protein
MLLFLARRLLLVVPVLFGLLALTFVLTRVIPADPAAALAGDQATPAQIAEIRRAYGFDRPIAEQFVHYLAQIGRGDLGSSYYTRRPVVEDLVERLPATLELTVLALVISVGLGVPLGVVAALHHNRWLDQALRIFSVGGIAIASFWLALMLQLVFSMELDLLPLRGRLSITGDAPDTLTGSYLLDALLTGRLDILADALAHIALPAATLAFGSLATIVRFSRSGVLETLQKDFVTFETAIGYPRRVIIAKYVLRNSLVSTVTQIGLLFGGLIAGAVVVEAVFDWPGIGGYAAGAVFTADFQPLLGVTLLIGTVYAGVNILVDLAHAWIDPRVAEQM